MQASVRPYLLLYLCWYSTRHICRISESGVHESVCEGFTLVYNRLLVCGHNVLGQAFKVSWHFDFLFLLWRYLQGKIVLAVLLDNFVDGGLGLHQGIDIMILQASKIHNPDISTIIFLFSSVLLQILHIYRQIVLVLIKNGRLLDNCDRSTLVLTCQHA